jgi:hypothetical protein
MQLSKRSRVVIGAAALLFGASTAFADDAAPFPECTKTPSSDDVEAAKQSHTIATSRFNLQDWDKAIEFWRQAYGFDCTAHALLVNIANAYEKKGDKKNAIAVLETYLTRAQGASDLVKVNERVLDLKKSMDPVPVVTATATVAVTAPTASATAAPLPAVVRPYGSVPLVIAGVGGAVALVGAILLPVGLTPYLKAQSECHSAAGCSAEVAQAGTDSRPVWNTGGALLGIGLGVAAGGLGFHFLLNQPKPAAAAPASSGAPAVAPSAPPASPKAQLDVLPLVSPQLSGFIFTGKF